MLGIGLEFARPIERGTLAPRQIGKHHPAHNCRMRWQHAADADVAGDAGKAYPHVRTRQGAARQEAEHKERLVPPPTLKGSLRCRQQRRESDKKTEQRSRPTRKDMFVSSRNSLTLPIQGLLRLYSRYGPPDRSAAHRRPLSRGSNPCGHPHKPLVSYRINRQLSGWKSSSTVIRAFGAHCHKPDSCSAAKKSHHSIASQEFAGDQKSLKRLRYLEVDDEVRIQLVIFSPVRSIHAVTGQYRLNLISIAFTLCTVEFARLSSLTHLHLGLL